VPAGFYNAPTNQYWTYVTNNGIRRATHDTLNSQVSSFNTVVSGSTMAGLGSTYRVESPGFALNVAGVSTTPTATPTITPTAGPTATPAATLKLPFVGRNVAGSS
jgi:hypothetical protein